MGVSTYGVVQESVTGFDVFEVIKNKIDPNVEHYLRTGYQDREEGNILFSYKGEDRRLFFCVTKDPVRNFDESREHSYSRLIVGAWGSSVELMELIVSQFGGYVDANDCDEEYYYEVPQMQDKELDIYREKRNAVKDILDFADLGIDVNLQTQISALIIRNYDKIKSVLEEK